MAKKLENLPVTNEYIKLLQEQNDLLRERNDLLRQLVSASNMQWGGGIQPQSKTREVFVENIDRDEMRDGFLVTSQRKKLWNAQIGLINEFARICKKHNLRWFVYAGTLLGAVRHKGFIPWDDDIDVAMLRPDYEKLKQVIASEIKPPYYLDIWYNYRLETDLPSELTDYSLPFISREHFKKYPLHAPFFPLIKIRDERTFFIEFPGEKNLNQSVWLDIFPMDSLPPFAEKWQEINFEIARTFYIAATHPEIIADAMHKGQRFVVDYAPLETFIKLPYQQRGIKLEEFLAKIFFMSERVGDIRDWCLVQTRRAYHSKDYRDVTYLPFEKIEVPAPIGYESNLTDFYGDWRKPVMYPPHVADYSTDISWEEYVKQSVMTF